MIHTLSEIHHPCLPDLPELPPLPFSAQQILAEITRDDVRIDHLAAAIEQDPGVTARIVGMANSAFFGSSEPIYSVSGAIVKVLGLNLVRSLTFGMVLSGPLRTNECPVFRPDDYWYTALVTANLARGAAPQLAACSAAVREQAYLCGLLHSFGLLVLVHCFPSAMQEILESSAAANADPLEEIETRHLGINHWQAGAVLARRWHVPDTVIAVMEHNADTAYRGRNWLLSGLVGLCADMVRADSRGDERKDDAALVTALGLPPDCLSNVWEQLSARRQQLRTAAQFLALY